MVCPTPAQSRHDDCPGLAHRDLMLRHFRFRQLGRPLREGERQLLTVLAGECVSSILLLRIEADKKDEAAKTIPPPHITQTRKGGGNGEL